MSIIRTESLAVGYGDKVVVDQVAIDALKGQIVCLLGPNGSGKTTILRTLAGLLSSVKGTVFINNEDLSSINQQKLAKMLAVVLTERPTPGLMTVFDIAAMGRYPHTGFFGKLTQTDIDVTMDALRMVHADYLAHRYFSELSDGEKQKVMIARAIVQEPELIILDEPTIHLDVKHKIEVISILKKMSKEKGITVVLSLHEIDLALKSCDTVLLVKDGKILDYGFPEDVIKENTIKELYDINTARYNDFLGTIELYNQCKDSVFIFGGAGSGTRLYRALTKRGYGIDTGIIHENDVDYFVAQSIGANIISEKPFEKISNETYANALKFIKKAGIIIDAGFAIGKNNEQNLSLLIEAIKTGKVIYSMRLKDEAKRLFDRTHLSQFTDKLIYCDSISDIVEKLSLEKCP
ncbi:MAG: ABC transporter ATP-binding protein [Halanaerobiales bacterium]|nr:ABC transporter ATP-binding protein [Halanaerobiales bacterium]